MAQFCKSILVMLRAILCVPAQKQLWKIQRNRIFNSWTLSKTCSAPNHETLFKHQQLLHQIRSERICCSSPFLPDISDSIKAYEYILDVYLNLVSSLICTEKKNHYKCLFKKYPLWGSMPSLATFNHFLLQQVTTVHCNKKVAMYNETVNTETPVPKESVFLKPHRSSNNIYLSQYQIILFWSVFQF